MKVSGDRATLGVGITEPSPRVKVSGSRATIWGIVGLSDPSPRVKSGRVEGHARSPHDRPKTKSGLTDRATLGVAMIDPSLSVKLSGLRATLGVPPASLISTATAA